MEIKMKKLKTSWGSKIVAVLLCAMFCASGLSPLATRAAAASEKEFYPDLLMKIGILQGSDEGKYIPENTITWGEFSVIAVRMMGMEESVITAGRYGAEVQKDCLLFLKARGFLNKIPSEIKAEEIVLYEQAVKVLINLLGYSDEILEGYPDNYIQLASQQRLLRGVTVKKAEPLTRKALAIMLDNALDIPVCLTNTVSGQGYRTTLDKNKTVLTEYLNIKKMVGVMTANHITGLKNEMDYTKEGYVRIGDTDFLEGGLNASKYLGYKIQVYYRDNEADNELELVFLETYRNNEALTVSAEDMIDMSLSSVSYYENDKKQTKRLSATVDVIYNERAYLGMTAQNVKSLMPDDGEVTWIDQDGNGIVDVLIVKSYTSHIVNMVNISESVVTFDDGASALKVEEDIVLRDPYGSPIELSALKKGLVLSVMTNPDNQKVQGVIVSNAWVRGEIKSKSIDPKQVFVNGEWYKYHKSLENVLDIGCVTTYYLDPQGKIVGYDKNTTATEKYAYLISAAMTQGLDKRIKLKLFEDSGNINIYTMKEKATFNEQRIRTEDDMVNMLSVLSNTPTKVGDISQPVLVRFIDGEVAVLKTLDENKTVTSNTMRYKKTPMVFYDGSTPKCYVDNNTKVFYVASKNNIGDYKYYKISGVSNIPEDKGFYNKSCVAYDVKIEEGSRYAPLLVIQFDQADSENLAVDDIGFIGCVSGISTVLNSDGDVVRGINLKRLIGGDRVIEIGEDDTTNYQIGDMVVYADATRLPIDMQLCKLLITQDEIFQRTGFFESSGDLNYGGRYEIGALHKVVDGFVTTGPIGDCDMADCHIYKSNRARVTIYDSKNQKYYDGTVADLAGYEWENNKDARVLAGTAFGELRFIVLYI